MNALPDATPGSWGGSPDEGARPTVPSVPEEGLRA